MSLLDHNRAFDTRDFILIILGLMGGCIFFLTYSYHEPRSLIDLSMDRESIDLNAVNILNDYGYNLDNPRSEINLDSKQSLLDSLQMHLGRMTAIDTLRERDYANIFPYSWHVELYDSFEEPQRSESGNPEGNRRNLVLHLDMKGQPISFENSDEVFPDRQLNRHALMYVFRADSNLKLWSNVPDSSWENVLTFNLEEGYDISSLSRDTVATGRPAEGVFPHQFTSRQVKRLGDYYLDQSAWTLANLQVEEISIRTIQSKPAAVINYESSEPELGQTVSVAVTVLPSGSLLKLTPGYNTSSSGEQGIIAQLRPLLLILFVIGVFVIGYLRIRARAVDTQSALVVGIILGLIITATVFVQQIHQFDTWGQQGFWDNFLELAFRLGITGAFTSIGFFALSAIADSLTRQYWPRKLFCYDYLRQGMFFNKPVGETLLRSVVLALLFLGIWSTVLFFFPQLYFDIDRTLLVDEASWPPLYLMLSNTWFSLFSVLSIFLVFGTQVYAKVDKSWLAGGAMIAVIALFAPVMQDFGPPLQEAILFTVMGLLFVYVFLKWDFITTLLVHFLFITFLEVSSGWVVSSSPDLYIFVIYCLFILFLIVWGTLSIARGKDQKTLPSYVPDYVEELAQEERIKQELEIARSVQQSFLPMKMPELEGIDIAAVCQPAYETGGDYYDVIKLDDHRYALTVGDVSGKGIQAAFYMTFTKGIIHSLCRETESPAEVLGKANRLFNDNAKKGTFISLVYGIIDVRKETFTFTRAGHNPVVKVDGNTGELTEMRPGGLGLGLANGSTFEKYTREVEVSFFRDDLFILYTDGIVEALNSDHQFYGTNKMAGILKGSSRGSAQVILDRLMSDVREFIGNAKQHDDMTLMVIKRES